MKKFDFKKSVVAVITTVILVICTQGCVDDEDGHRYIEIDAQDMELYEYWEWECFPGETCYTEHEYPGTDLHKYWVLCETADGEFKWYISFFIYDCEDKDGDGWPVWKDCDDEDDSVDIMC